MTSTSVSSSPPVGWNAALVRRRRGPLGLSTRAWVALAQIGLFFGIVAIWELLTLAQLLNPFFIGQPSAIFRIMVRRIADGSLIQAAQVTIVETLLGFTIGMIVGTTLGLCLWWSAVVSRIFEPIAIMLNAIPKIALAPIFFVWFGLGLPMKVSLSVSACIFVALLTAYSGTKQVDRDLLDLGRAMGATKSQLFWKIVLPTSLPWIISGMDISIGFALVGAVVGEFLASNQGLGYLALWGASIFDMSVVWAAVLTLLLLSIVMYVGVRWLEDRLMPWRPNQRA
ncbi:MAG: ABC transporter permease [Chloroflexi bacterium]|nr:ABC transporter permease [Chloroflexota bacterium]